MRDGFIVIRCDFLNHRCKITDFEITADIAVIVEKFHKLVGVAAITDVCNGFLGKLLDMFVIHWLIAVVAGSEKTTSGSIDHSSL